MLEAEEYPLTITDAGNRVRSFGYYLASDTYGSVGQLKTVTDLAGKSYTLQYYKPDVSPYTAQLRYVKAPPSPVINQGTISETLLEYTYDSQERVETVKYAGLNTMKRFHYDTTENGAKHLPSRIDLPNGGGIEYRYEENTGRVEERYLKRAGQTDSNADEKASYSYNRADQVTRINWEAPADSATTQSIDYLYGREVRFNAASSQVLFADANRVLQEGDNRGCISALSPNTALGASAVFVFNSVRRVARSARTKRLLGRRSPANWPEANESSSETSASPA